VNDARTAISAAKRAAKRRQRAGHGAATAHLALAAGVFDELKYTLRGAVVL
jgi:hypothetical protein